MGTRTVKGATIAQAWEESLRLFFQPRGLNRADIRGDPCLEIEDVFFDIKYPQREPIISPFFPSRFIPFIESFTDRLIKEQAGHTSNINDRLFRWKKRDGTILNQLNAEVDVLRANPEGRKGIIGFWDPEIDLFNDKPIGPIMAYYRVRSQKLNATVVSRSLEAITGAVQLIVGFSNLQNYLAQAINKEVGSLRVLALSYHLLDMDLPFVLSQLENKPR